MGSLERRLDRLEEAHGDAKRCASCGDARQILEAVHLGEEPYDASEFVCPTCGESIGYMPILFAFERGSRTSRGDVAEPPRRETPSELIARHLTSWRRRLERPDDELAEIERHLNVNDVEQAS
jgi:hypothetical protein